MFVIHIFEIKLYYNNDTPIKLSSVIGSKSLWLYCRFTKSITRELLERKRVSSSEENSAMASKLVVIIVFILDLIAVGLAIAAEQRRSVVSPHTLFLPSFTLYVLVFALSVYVILRVVSTTTVRKLHSLSSEESSSKSPSVRSLIFWSVFRSDSQSCFLFNKCTARCVRAVVSIQIGRLYEIPLAFKGSNCIISIHDL